MSAKYYIYRNLHRGQAFSVKHRGRVIERQEQILALDVEFHVSDAGRRRAVAEGKRNVHAYAVADRYVTYTSAIGTHFLQPISYNPFKGPTFTVNGEPILRAYAVVFEGGRCWLAKWKSHEKPAGISFDCK